MSSSLAGLSASVTRILSLTGFSKELKTKDIHTAFADWENVNGGFKIKWRDDTSLLIVFQDATVAKRAYLHTLAYPPAILTASDGISATIKPYDGKDAQVVIQDVNSRGHHSNPSRSHNNRSNSISVFPGNRVASNSVSSATNMFRPPNANGGQTVTIPEYVNGREPSPTLPNLPAHPTLNSLISSSLGDGTANGNAPPDPAIIAAVKNEPTTARGPPQIGDPGKRMVAAGLGVRHPSLGQKGMNGSANGNAVPGATDQAVRDIQRAMGGLLVE